MVYVRERGREGGRKFVDGDYFGWDEFIIIIRKEKRIWMVLSILGTMVQKHPTHSSTTY